MMSSTQGAPGLPGRDGMSNDELVAAWPRWPNEKCSHCGARGFVTYRLSPPDWLCDDCLTEGRAA